jgi:hypothetical protein
MSQHVRRVVAALGLMAALLLAAPPPSQAAGLWDPPPLPGVARAWAWLESLWPGVPPTVSAPQRPVRAEKPGAAAGLTSLAAAAPPPAGTADEGSAIDPNGHK